MDIVKALFGTPQFRSRTDTTADSPDLNPDDIWGLTDPDARDLFAEQGRLKELEHDLRFEVMRGGPWQEDELQYKREIRRLLQEGKLVDKGTYWHASPFSTVYRAVRSGSLAVGDIEYRFRVGDEIVFQCRMTRDMNRKLRGPLFIGRLSPTRKASLCGEMSGAMKGMGGKM
ncbi:MAG TPA: hypothetical protein VJK02_07940 [Anaerolineales bacterium]|nr:hypothetical protein [Anaerolineales bacterium]